MKDSVVSLILGGGVGSRLYPLTAHRSKPAVPVAGKYRLIDIPISNCLNSGIRKMLVLTQFNSASLNNHIKNTYQFDMFSHGFVDIFAAEQTLGNKDWFQGTADAVRQVLPRLHNMEYEYVMVLSGDQLYQMDFTNFLKSHVEADADLSIATIPVHAAHAPAFGIMKVNAAGEISNFIEKPDPSVLPEWASEVDERYASQGRHYLASMGIYIFNRRLLNDMLEAHPEEMDFGKGIIPMCINEKRNVISHPYDGYWTDIGTIRSFFEANIALTDPIPEFNLFDNEHPIYSRARMLSPSKLYGTQCQAALVADGCIIHADKLERCIIGIRSRLGPGVVMRNTYYMGQDFYQDIAEILNADRIPMGVGENTRIENAIIDRNVCIGKNVTIIGHDSLEDTENDVFCINGGIIVIRKGAVIQDGTTIGASPD